MSSSSVVKSPTPVAVLPTFVLAPLVLMRTWSRSGNIGVCTVRVEGEHVAVPQVHRQRQQQVTQVTTGANNKLDKLQPAPTTSYNKLLMVSRFPVLLKLAAI